MFEQTCRTCLSTNGEMVPIFSSGFYVNQLPKKLMAFIQVEISDNDALPKVICKKCMFLADSFYCFKEQCESADNQLKTLIQTTLNTNHSLDKEKKNHSDEKSSKTDLELITTSKNANLGLKNPKNEAKNVSEEPQETEENYTIDYISDEVRIEVENASKRRQEAEKRISIEKVSQSIKNLKGIEVLPISDVVTERSERNNRIKREEIVVFPVKVPKKRCKVIETVVIEDPPPLKKRLKLPPETTVSKINGDGVKSEDYIVYGKHKKLNFSTVRKVVKIDDEELCLEPKQEIVKESDKENYRIKYDTDLMVDNDSDKEKPLLQYSEIQIDKKRSEFHCRKQEPDVLEDKLEEDSKDEEKNFKTQIFKLLDIVPVHNQNAIDQNDDNKQKNDPLIQNDNESNHHPSTMGKPVKIMAKLESNELQRHKVSNNFQNHDIVERSTIGRIISGIDDQIFDDISQADDEDVSTFENSNDGPKSFDDYRTDKSNEVFIENEVSDGRGNGTTVCGIKAVQSLPLHQKNCPEFSKIEQGKLKENSNMESISIAGDQPQNFDQARPLALLAVISSGEESSTMNSEIHKRNDSEKIERTAGGDLWVKDQSPDSSFHQKLGNSNLKYYQCTICSMNFVSMPVVPKHNIQEHMAEQAPLSCLICDKSFPDKPSLSEHVEEHNGLKPYKCTFCPKTFTLKRNLKRHVNHHINYKPFQCRICMKRFTEKSSLKSHMYLHTGDSPFACKSCNVSFNNKTNWRRHVMTIHEKLTVVVCEFCNKELPDRRSLQVHSRVHTGYRPYQCPHCDKRFTQQCNLNTHIHCHLNDRPFGCPHCGKGFNQRGTRDDHILTHTGEKPHKCTECDASFTVSSALKRHMWIHTDKDRPYNCEKCKLQFVGLYDLRRHLKIRHGEVVKLENPRVERVLTDDQSTEADAAITFGQSELDLNESGAMDSVQSSKKTECSKAEITAKENSSLSCNVNKVEDSQIEEMKENFSETKFENFNNGAAKKELVNNS